MRYVVMGLIYADAVKLKLALLARDVEAGETAGALAIYPDTEDQIAIMYAVCRKHGTTPKKGTSLMEDLGTGRITEDEIIAIALKRVAAD